MLSYRSISNYTNTRQLSEVASKYLDYKYLTLFRALLIALFLPCLIVAATGGEFKKYFLVAYMALGVLTFFTETLLYVFQFTRRENFWVELIILLVLIPVAVVLV